MNIGLRYNPWVIIPVVFGVLFMLFGHREVVSAGNNYAYHLSVNPQVHRLIVKPTFQEIQSDFTITNLGDPIYMQINNNNDSQLFDITIQDLAKTANTTTTLNWDKTFLLGSLESKQVRISISNIARKLENRDYMIDISILASLPQKPSNSLNNITIEPMLHKYIILSISPDGNTELLPKIAIFQNKDNPILIANKPANIILTIQNIGNYAFPIGGSITLVGPNSVEKKYAISDTYIFANSQKNLRSTESGDDGVLLSIKPEELATGYYTTTVDLQIPGSETPHLYGRTSFWVISPTIIILIVTMLISVIAVLFYFALRRP